MKKIFTKKTIIALLKGQDDMGIYQPIFDKYREICGDDVNSIYNAISGYAVVHRFGVNTNISEFTRRESAWFHLQDLAGNVEFSKRDTYFANHISSWEIVRL